MGGDSLGATATSLRQELGPAAPDRAEVLPEILFNIESALDDYFRGGFAAIRARYEPHCALRGRTVVIDGTRPCQVLGLDDDGALLVQRAPGGPPQRVESGDVWLAP